MEALLLSISLGSNMLTSLQSRYQIVQCCPVNVHQLITYLSETHLICKKETLSGVHHHLFVTKCNKGEIHLYLEAFVILYEKMALVFLMRKGSGSNTPKAIRKQPWKHLEIELEIVPH